MQQRLKRNKAGKEIHIKKLSHVHTCLVISMPALPLDMKVFPVGCLTHIKTMAEIQANGNDTKICWFRHEQYMLFLLILSDVTTPLCANRAWCTVRHLGQWTKDVNICGFDLHHGRIFMVK